MRTATSKTAFKHAAKPGEGLVDAKMGYAGIAMGKAYVIRNEFKEPPDTPVPEALRELEAEKFAEALRRAQAAIAARKNKIDLLPIEAQAEARDLQRVAEGIVNDPSLRLKSSENLLGGEIVQSIANGKTAERAVYESFKPKIDTYSQHQGLLKSVYLETQLLMCDLIRHMNPTDQPHSLENAPDGSIPVIEYVNFGEAHLLRAPGEEGGSRISAIINWLGTKNDHWNIIARASEVVVAIGSKDEILRHIKHDDLLIIDGRSGQIIVNPSDETQAAYKAIIEKQKLANDAFLKKSQADEHWPRTLDKETIRVGANIGHSNEFRDVHHAGAHAVGLVRTEMAVHMRSSKLPKYEEWYEIFAHYVKKAKGLKITIRTIDVDGDKKIPLIPNKEKQDQVTRAQLKAATRLASEVGEDKIAVMIPVIRSKRHFEKYQAMANEVATELKLAPLNLGTMAEKRIFVNNMHDMDAAFYSIGDNDLVASCLDFNRFDEEEVAEYYDPTHPVVLKTIQKIVRHGAGIRKDPAIGEKKKIASERPVSMCGDMAGNPRYFALAVGCGIRNFSAGAARVPEMKELAKRIDTNQAQILVDRLRKIDGEHNRAERERLLDDYNKKYLGVNPDGSIDLEWERPAPVAEAEPAPVA